MGQGKTNSRPPNGGTPGKRGPSPGFGWAGLKLLVENSFSEWNRQNVPRLGASVAFYSLLSLAPLLLLLVSIVGVAFGHSAADREIIQHMEALMGPAAAKAAGEFLRGAHNQRGGIIGTLAGLLTLLFSASGVLVEMRDDLNTIWEVPVPQISGIAMVASFVKERLFSFAMVLAIGFLLVVSLLVSTWISAMGGMFSRVPATTAVLLHIVNIGISFLVVAAVFTAIYKIVPDIHIEWRNAAIGGGVTAILFTLGKFILGLYLGRASYSSMYGAAGSIVVLIAWVYYSAQIFYLGAEFTKVFTQTYASRQDARPT